MPLPLRCLLSLVLFVAAWLPNMSQAHPTQALGYVSQASDIGLSAAHSSQQSSCQVLDGLEGGLRDLGTSLLQHELKISDDDRNELYWATIPPEPAVAPRCAPSIHVQAPQAGPWPRIPLRPPSAI